MQRPRSQLLAYRCTPSQSCCCCSSYVTHLKEGISILNTPGRFGKYCFYCTFLLGTFPHVSMVKLKYITLSAPEYSSLLHHSISLSTAMCEPGANIGCFPAPKPSPLPSPDRLPLNPSDLPFPTPKPSPLPSPNRLPRLIRPIPINKPPTAHIPLHPSSMFTNNNNRSTSPSDRIA
jgi:hypothetical protein